MWLGRADDAHALLADREAYDTEEAISGALGDYRAFLGHVQHSVEPLVPTMIVDLVWHTHMLHPRRYAAETRELAGSFVDHDDDVVVPLEKA